MENLIVRTQDNSLHIFEQNWLNWVVNNHAGNAYPNPSASLYTSMVYGFAKHLPYSMDIEQPEYVPADFLNMIPLDVETNNWFKWEDRRTFFNSMVKWSDTYRTGVLLQICNVFQKMILGQFPANFELSETDYVDWGIDKLTSNEEYNRRFFEILRTLPFYYQRVVNSPNNEERRKSLDEMYAEVINKIAARYGGFREKDVQGNIVRESMGVIPIYPHKDVELRVYGDNIRYHDGIPPVIQVIKEEQLKSYHKKDGLPMLDDDVSSKR